MKLPLIDRIWRVRGEVPLNPPLEPAEAFARLDPLLQTPGTTCAVDGDTLAYTKRNPAAQDRLATFSSGTLKVERRGAGTVLRFDLASPALLLCFLAPLLFLGFAQLAVGINTWEKGSAEASEIATKDEDEPKPPEPLNPVDQFLGAPAPDDPTKKKDREEEEEEERHSPETGYVLAGIFFLTYLVGRWLEPWLVRRRFRAALASPTAATPESPTMSDPAVTS
jgi:hypothetical protein